MEQPKFFFYSKSRDCLPGKGANETGNPDDFQELRKIKDWRKILSNFHVSPFEWNGRTWNSIEHAFQATKIALADPDKAFLFTMESQSELGLGDGAMAQKNRKIVKLSKEQIRQWGAQSSFVMEDIARSKYMQCELAATVLQHTKDAELWHIVSRKPATRFEHLERLRNTISL